MLCSNLEALPNTWRRPPTTRQRQGSWVRATVTFLDGNSATLRANPTTSTRQQLNTMADTESAPAQYKQPSRKGKKAWRKNVDVTQINSGLEDVRDQIILGYVTRSTMATVAC